MHESHPIAGHADTISGSLFREIRGDEICNILKKKITKRGIKRPNNTP